MNNETHTRTPHIDVFLYQRALLLVWAHCMTLLYYKNGQDASLASSWMENPTNVNTNVAFTLVQPDYSRVRQVESCHQLG